MTFEQLSYFAEVYRLKSITQAADNLFVSRQAVSLSIKKLEEEFGVILFTRLANGVEPTKAGDTFHKSVQVILREHTLLKQNMLQYAPQKIPNKICTIGMPESIMTLHGQQIFNTLSVHFPKTYFDLHIINATDQPAFYQESSISIIVTSAQRKEKYLKSLPNQYVIKHITTWPIYIWVSACSPWNEYESLTFELLKDTPFCALKNSYSGRGFLNYLAKDYHYKFLDKYPIIDLEQNFIDRIEKFNYFTIDIPLQNKLFYSDIFNSKNVILKPTPYSFICTMIYDKEVGNDFYPFIADILTQ